MGSVRLTVRKGPDAAPDTIAFDVNGPAPSFAIATERVAGWSLSHVDNRLLDLLDVAGAIFAADGIVTRGGSSRPGFGARWRRELDFDIAVRDPTFWNDGVVRAALAAAVEFLTDDQVDFSFRKSAVPAPRQDYLQFDPESPEPDGEAHVVLFSGGLDSLAGALETLTRERGRVVLVTHRSAPKIISHQDLLAEELRRRFGDRVSYVPIRATFKDRKAGERTQRSRSFLFAAFGYVIARTVGADRLNFFENSVVSHNLPLSPQIIGTMATRTTHPYALRKFEDLLGLIDGRRFFVRNGFEWLTKTEVVGKLREHGAADLIRHAVSCNSVYDRRKVETHCGACSQCLDRRFGILAAGLAGDEPETLYETPVLMGGRAEPMSQTMALEWTRHAMRLATMEPAAFQERFGGDVARIAQGYPEMAGGEVLRRCLDLQVRHGRAVRRVLEGAAAAHAPGLVGGALPSTSLLRVFMADATRDPAIVAITPGGADQIVAADEARWPDEDEAHDGRLVVRLIGEGRQRRIEVKNLGTVDGAPAGPAFALRHQFAADRLDDRPPDDHRYVPAGHMTPEAGSSKSAVTQNVKRCRKELAENYQTLVGRPPERALLIQNKKGSGYRLDPCIKLVEPSG
ncbi:MAG: hypothetical protein WD969_09915 [Paracoccaceae bacterium]